MKQLLFILILLSTSAQGGILRENFQSARFTGMGNAGIALTDNGDMLWYNPAALAHVKGWHYNLFDFTLGADTIETLTRMKNLIFEGDSASLIAEDLTFLRGQYKQTFLTKYFGFGFYTNAQGFWQISNLELPEVDIYAFADIGAIAGLGIPVTKYLSLGASLRFFERSGADSTISTLDLLANLGGITQADFMAAIYDELRTISGTGYAFGINLGALAKIPLGKGKNDPELRLAATVEDFANTNFIAIGTTKTPPSIPQTYHFGAALSYQLNKNNQLNFEVDIRHFFEEATMLKKTHIGAEYRNNIWAIRGGLHQGYLTYGVSFEGLPHTKIHFSSYGVELGTTPLEFGHRWYLLQAVIGFNPF